MVEMQPELSIVIPAFNEEASLPRLIHSIENKVDTPMETLVVLDGGTDSSLDILKRLRADGREWLKVIALERNHGQHQAIAAAFPFVKGRFVITLDADLQNPPEAIPMVLSKLKEGFDGVGTTRKLRQDNPVRKLVSAGFRFSTSIMFPRFPVRDPGSMLRGYSVKLIELFGEDRIEPRYLPFQLLSYADSYFEFPVGHNAREQGRSSYNLLGLVKLFGMSIAALKKKKRREDDEIGLALTLGLEGRPCRD